MEIGHLSLMDESALVSKLLITRAGLRRHAQNLDIKSESFRSLHDTYHKAYLKSYDPLGRYNELVDIKADLKSGLVPKGRVELSMARVERVIDGESMKIEDSLGRWFFRTVAPREIDYPTDLDDFDIHMFAWIFSIRDEWPKFAVGREGARLVRYLAERYEVTAVTYSSMRGLNIEQSITIVDGEASPFTATGLLMNRDAYDWISEVCPNWSKVVRAIQASILILEK